MSAYFDTSVIVEAILGNPTARQLLKSGGHTCSHTIAECFSTMTGKLKMNHEDCWRLLDAWLFERLTIEDCKLADYRAVLKTSKAHGVRGGAFFDALHLQVASRLKSNVIYTINLSDFQSIWRGDKEQIKDPSKTPFPPAPNPSAD